MWFWEMGRGGMMNGSGKRKINVCWLRTLWIFFPSRGSRTVVESLSTAGNEVPARFVVCVCRVLLV